MKYYLLTSAILFIILFVIILTLMLRKPQITFYKCPHKPSGELLKMVMKENVMVQNSQNHQLYMPCGYNYVEQELEKANINSPYIFGLKGCDKIVSKNNLWKILESTFGRYGAAKIMPESFLIGDEIQYSQAHKEIRNGNPLICKKNLQRKLGIKFAFTEDELEQCRKEDFKVAQKFLVDSWAIKNRKVNLRVYLLVVKKDHNIHFYLHNNGKLLYTKNHSSGKITFESHITSYQMDSELYEKEQMPHNLNELRKHLGKRDFNNLWNKIKNNIKLLCESIATVFEDEQYNKKTCFQLFGLDVIVEKDHPYILEVNKGPDMIPKCYKDIQLKKQVYEDCFHRAGVVKKMFKRNGFGKIFSYKY